MNLMKPARIPYSLDFEARLSQYDFLDSERTFAVFLGHFYNTLSLYFQEHWKATFSSSDFVSAIKVYAFELGKSPQAVEVFVCNFIAAEEIFQQFENEYSFTMGLLKGGFWKGISILVELKEKCLLYEDIKDTDFWYPLTSLGLSGQSLYDLMRAGKHVFEKFSPEKFSRLLERMKELVYHDPYKKDSISLFDFVKSFIALYVLQKAYYQDLPVANLNTNPIETASKPKNDILIAKRNTQRTMDVPLMSYNNRQNCKLTGMRTVTKFTILEVNRGYENASEEMMASPGEILNAIKLIEHENRGLSQQHGNLLKELEVESQLYRQNSKRFIEMFDFLENTHSMIRKMS